jgi:hypothetical protein
VGDIVTLWCIDGQTLVIAETPEEALGVALQANPASPPFRSVERVPAWASLLLRRLADAESAIDHLERQAREARRALLKPLRAETE